MMGGLSSASELLHCHCRIIRSLKLDLEEDDTSGRVVLYIPEGMHPHFWVVNAPGFSTEGSEWRLKWVE